MHGGTTAIFAIVSKSRRVSLGFVIAFILHSLFNHFILSPAMSTLVIVLILPPLLVVVFAQSERLVPRRLVTRIAAGMFKPEKK